MSWRVCHQVSFRCRVSIVLLLIQASILCNPTDTTWPNQAAQSFFSLQMDLAAFLITRMCDAFKARRTLNSILKVWRQYGILKSKIGQWITGSTVDYRIHDQNQIRQLICHERHERPQTWISLLISQVLCERRSSSSSSCFSSFLCFFFFLYSSKEKMKCSNTALTWLGDKMMLWHCLAFFAFAWAVPAEQIRDRDDVFVGYSEKHDSQRGEIATGESHVWPAWLALAKSALPVLSHHSWVHIQWGLEEWTINFAESRFPFTWKTHPIDRMHFVCADYFLTHSRGKYLYSISVSGLSLCMHWRDVQICSRKKRSTVSGHHGWFQSLSWSPCYGPPWMPSVFHKWIKEAVMLCLVAQLMQFICRKQGHLLIFKGWGKTARTTCLPWLLTIVCLWLCFAPSQIAICKLQHTVFDQQEWQIKASRWTLELNLNVDKADAACDVVHSTDDEEERSTDYKCYWEHGKEAVTLPTM